MLRTARYLGIRFGVKMSPFPRNRYKPEEFIEAFARAEVQTPDYECRVILEVAGEEIDILFPVASQHYESASAHVHEVLSGIAALDNLVQESCESNGRRNGLASFNYELELAYIELNGSSLLLGYFGSKVNTSWDAKFKRVNGQWQKVNF